MALNGQLHDFNLAEILQLIATQQKSGFLVLEGRREMVFIFDKGLLISTRDRRTETSDPLEVFLRNYGFFTEDQWAHIGYIRKNSSLDLTEILISEELFSREDLDNVLKNVAVEMAHKGMKMRRGRYHFSATKDTPPNVRWRIAMDVQGLLMEAARRVDEEPQLASLFPSQSVSFERGSVPPPPDALSPTGRRIIKLALGGRPLGRIIRLARTDSFTTREMIKAFLDIGWLQMVIPVDDQPNQDGHLGNSRSGKRKTSLRHPILMVILALVLLGFGSIRWAPLAQGEFGAIGLADPAPGGAADPELKMGLSGPDTDRLASRQLRQRQIKAMVNESIHHYHSAHGSYPDNLELLVREGLMAKETWRTVSSLGWTYAPLETGIAYQIKF